LPNTEPIDPAADAAEAAGQGTDGRVAVVREQPQPRVVARPGQVGKPRVEGLVVVPTVLGERFVDDRVAR
jgi:hypothetical protein